MPKAGAAELGLNPLAWSLIGLQAFAACLVAFAISRLHLSLSGWHGEIVTAGGFCLCLGLWLQFLVMPGRSGSRESRAAEMMLVLILMIMSTMIGSIAQYPAVALARPYADQWLANADAALGINVSDLAAWTARRPALLRLLALSYNSYAPQLVLTLVGLAVVDDRRRLWEFAFHYSVCLTVAVVGLALWPALCAPVHYGFNLALDMSRPLTQIRGLHDGTMSTIPLNELDGLVSIPSFHVIGALIVTWAWRRHFWVLVPVTGLNLLLVASTFMTGVHYFADVLAGVVVFALSVAAYHAWPCRLLVSTIDTPRKISGGAASRIGARHHAA